MAQKVRIKLKSFDHTLVDQSAEKIVKTKWSFFLDFTVESYGSIRQLPSLNRVGIETLLHIMF